MSDTTQRRRRPAWRPLAVAVTGGALLVTTGFGLWATLNATAFNTSPESVNSGTLVLGLANNGVGFSAAVSNMAPGDTVNRYVNLTNSGTLASQNLTLAIAPSVNNALVTDGTNPSTTKALHVTVSSCATAFTPTTGACSGGATVLLPSTVLSALSTTTTLSSAQVAAAGVTYLQISLVLPDQTETTANGVGPTSTIQGLTTTLTYTFGETQRTATTTNSSRVGGVVRRAILVVPRATLPAAVPAQSERGEVRCHRAAFASAWPSESSWVSLRSPVSVRPGPR